MDPVNRGSSSAQPINSPQRQHQAAPHSSPGSEQIAACLSRMSGESASARGSSSPSVGPIRTSRHRRPPKPSGLRRIPSPGLERTAARLCRCSGETTSAGTSRTLTPGPAQASHRGETSRTGLVVPGQAYQNIPGSYNMPGNSSGQRGLNQMLPSHEVDFQPVPLIDNQPLPPRGGDQNHGNYMASGTVQQSRSSQLPSSSTSNMNYLGGLDPTEHPIHSTHGPAIQQPNNEMVSQSFPPTNNKPPLPRRGDRNRGSQVANGTMAQYRSSQLPSTSNLYTYSGFEIDPFAKLIVSIRGTPLQHPIPFMNEIAVDRNGNIYIGPAVESCSHCPCPLTLHTHCSSSDINPLANPIHSSHGPSHQQPFPANHDRTSPSLGGDRNIRCTTASKSAYLSTSIAPSTGPQNRRRSYCEHRSTPLVYPETMTPTPAAVAFAESWIPANPMVYPETMTPTSAAVAFAESWIPNDPLPSSHVHGGHQCTVMVQQSSSTVDAVPRTVPRPNLHSQRILQETAEAANVLNSDLAADQQDELPRPRSTARPSMEPHAEVSDSESQC